METYNHVFTENEQEANRYTAYCMRGAAITAVVMWILNIIGFFIVEKKLMNGIMPVSILFFLLPTPLVRYWKGKPEHLKYLIMGSFLLGISGLASVLTMHALLAWSCPLILSCHFYNQRFTRHTLCGIIVCMIVSHYIGLYVGVWDSNMMLGNASLGTVAERAAYLKQMAAEGKNILIRSFNFYCFPRSILLVMGYLISETLSKRTHGLLQKQEEITREGERIKTELNAATLIQTSMLPNVFPAFPERDEFEIYATMDPAKEVGGDFYDFFMVDEDHLALVIADVSGKGIPAALFMVTAKLLLKNTAQTGISPREVLENVNNQLCENNEAQMFVSVWLGIMEISTGKLTAVNAGHEYPVLRHMGAKFELIKDKHGLVLAGMEDVSYTEYEMQLGKGDLLFVYTDGVVEATNAQNEMFGTGRMLQALQHAERMYPEDCCIRVRKEIEDFVGDAPQFDDITMLAVRIN